MDQLKEEATRNAQEVAAGLKAISPRERQLLKTWESVEYARLRAIKAIEDLGVFEPSTSRGQKMPKEAKAVGVLNKCAITSAKLLNELFPGNNKHNLSEESDKEDLDDY